MLLYIYIGLVPIQDIITHTHTPLCAHARFRNAHDLGHFRAGHISDSRANKSDLETAEAFEKLVDHLVLKTHDEMVVRGTPELFPWKSYKELAEKDPHHLSNMDEVSFKGKQAQEGKVIAPNRIAVRQRLLLL